MTGLGQALFILFRTGKGACAIGNYGLIQKFICSKRAGRGWLNAPARSQDIALFFWGLLAIIFVGVLAGHQSLEVIDRDEARFAQASKQMLLSGDLITPYFMDELRAKNLLLFIGCNLHRRLFLVI